MASQHFGTFPRAFFETVLAAILRREVAHLVQRTTEEDPEGSKGIRRHPKAECCAIFWPVAKHVRTTCNPLEEGQRPQLHSMYDIVS